MKVPQCYVPPQVQLLIKGQLGTTMRSKRVKANLHPRGRHCLLGNIGFLILLSVWDKLISQSSVSLLLQTKRSLSQASCPHSNPNNQLSTKDVPSSSTHCDDDVGAMSQEMTAEEVDDSPTLFSETCEDSQQSMETIPGIPSGQFSPVTRRRSLDTSLYIHQAVCYKQLTFLHELQPALSLHLVQHHCMGQPASLEPGLLSWGDYGRHTNSNSHASGRTFLLRVAHRSAIKG